MKAVVQLVFCIPRALYGIHLCINLVDLAG